MQTLPNIQCEQLTVRLNHGDYSGKPLTISADAGSIISIIGPGHTGKHEWLRTIGGIDQPASGRLSLLGKNTELFSKQDWVNTRCKIAYIKSDTAILSAANAVQNIMLPALYHGLGTQSEIMEKTLQLLKEIDVNCDLSSLPSYIRRDQRYRIAVARAMILEPISLLLDNPFAALDLSTTRRFKQYLLNRIKNHGLSLITVTHDINFAIKHSDRIIFTAKNNIHLFDKEDKISNCDIPEVREFIDTNI